MSWIFLKHNTNLEGKTFKFTYICESKIISDISYYPMLWHFLQKKKKNKNDNDNKSKQRSGRQKFVLSFFFLLKRNTLLSFDSSVPVEKRTFIYVAFKSSHEVVEGIFYLTLKFLRRLIPKSRISICLYYLHFFSISGYIHEFP